MLAVVNVMGFCISPLMCKIVKWLAGMSFYEMFVTLFVQSKVRGTADSKVVLLCISCSLTYSSL
jgi:hypothetical protein